MSRYRAAEGFAHGNIDETTGILLVNLGTPAAPTPSAVRTYLAEFLSDPRVIELPRWLWLPILHGVILRIRPARSAKAYAEIWSEQGSPLMVYSRKQEAALAATLHEQHGDKVKVRLAMRYGEPSIASVLREMQNEQLRRLIVLPLYPQYSASTTASIFDAVTRELSEWRWVPELRYINAYHDRPGYIASLVQSIRDHWQTHGQPERLLFSFHGLPRRYLDAGDPYHCQCHKSARLVADALSLSEGQWMVSFQSRVGREEWLRPYTDETLQQWGSEGLGSVQVVCPGFAADCLETLEEIALQNRDFFCEAGGGEFSYIPALNDRPDHVQALAELVNDHLAGWPIGVRPTKDDVAQTAARAKALGATA